MEYINFCSSNTLSEVPVRDDERCFLVSSLLSPVVCLFVMAVPPHSATIPRHGTPWRPRMWTGPRPWRPPRPS